MGSKWIDGAVDNPIISLSVLGEYKRTCDWMLKWFRENAPLITWDMQWPESWEDFKVIFRDGALYFLYAEVVVSEHRLCMQYSIHDLELRYANMGKERYLGLVLRHMTDELAEALMKKE